ncbi:MAG: thiol-disulfide isomerase/thioredoxin [Vicingaceae bacterium]|jgi:thiol-disulfide isomerase/thioredoxin
MKWIFSSSIVIALFFAACENSAPTEELSKVYAVKSGKWKMQMELEKGKLLPFEFDFREENGAIKMQIFNAGEVIEVDEIEQRNDSLFIQLPIFDSNFKLKIETDTSLNGVWNNYYQSQDYSIPVAATYGKNTRFSNIENGLSEDFGGKYEVVFSPKSKDQSNAIGLFEQEGNTVTGTFATETGDYRHLAGNASGKKLLLSTFDGSHAFLFEAEQTDSGLVGVFYSGTHWKENWVAQKNDSVELRNPNNLTFIKEGYEGLAFKFPNASGDSISLSDKKFENKPIIVQIMGSWCPNCLDETRYLSALYNNYNKQGLEVIALAFERTRTKEKAFDNVARLKERTGANYTFLLGGATREDKAAEKLPMLNHIMSYPTAIFIDKNKKVRRVHTGFYGPSTGKFYNDFVTETEILVEKMLNEK